MEDALQIPGSIWPYVWFITGGSITTILFEMRMLVWSGKQFYMGRLPYDSPPALFLTLAVVFLFDTAWATMILFGAMSCLRGTKQRRDVCAAAFVETLRRCDANDRKPFMANVCEMLGQKSKFVLPSASLAALGLIRECSPEERRSFNAMLYLVGHISTHYRRVHSRAQRRVHVRAHTRYINALIEMYPSEEEIKKEYERGVFGDRCNQFFRDTECTILHLLATDESSTAEWKAETKLEWMKWREMACKVLRKKRSSHIEEKRNHNERSLTKQVQVN